jgi:hypothetical protein
MRQRNRNPNSDLGRAPVEGVARDTVINMRVTDSTKALWIRRAHARGLSLSDWIRAMCEREEADHE